VRQPGVFFVTTDTWQRRPLFINNAWANLVCDHICECRDREFSLLHEFVLMPDHLHLLITPAPTVTIEKAMQMIKGGSAFKLKREFLTTFPIWHAGFHDRWVRNAGEYSARVQYIRMNPAKARLSERPEGYAWSSVSGRYALDASRFEAVPQGLKPPYQWRQYVAAKAATYKAKPVSGADVTSEAKPFERVGATPEARPAQKIQATYKSGMHKVSNRMQSQGEKWQTN
jgi:putative transposase